MQNRWSVQIDITTANFNKYFGALTNEQLNLKIAPSSWSIAQNIQHLIIASNSYFPVIYSVKEGNYKPPFTSKFSFIVSFFGGFILKGVQPDRRRKYKTFQFWEPLESSIPQGILQEFEKNQILLKDMIEDSADLLENNTVISSPANRNIVYKLESAFDIIVAHQLRHLEQAKEVLQHIKQ